MASSDANTKTSGGIDILSVPKKELHPKAILKNYWPLIIFGLFIVLFVSAIVALKLYKDAQPADISKLVLKPDANDPYLGKFIAPLVVVEAADIRCPGCKNFYDNIEPDLKRNYIDTGKIKFYFWDVLIDNASLQASEATYCANDQGKYWEYRSEFLVLPRDEGNWGKILNRSEFIAIAQDLNLDTAVFGACLDSEKYKDKVLEKSEQALATGMTFSPTLFLSSGKVLPGVGFYNTLANEIDRFFNLNK
ncbi:MAG: hypothetical protein A3A80_02520 [Candidatus Terrybacteria bacterium RIFCSPLOWO2_01_FULL_44_24]|uniref:Thioredoxin-like fold domain-containing protein n=1 Tax=Candidatus Terrybacteria bacterium RIFCSPHIGHO2_01_FULL_43_35 TaxID=1802361 RepID=A0A1G2PGG7_9BACT|nr:MAG: hypothetical protein A2828_02315 [Candidatus Terrybacteria bacterium RIFCSPHIGHO2_01_FULL_43_35]OHA50299.1 MAG: hypothetical protein A3B75_00680 [Candidatus Terrybacteria bacterium RIFCSPHIGHO2_02_FULL_43_14]OHA50948.1 MAG: hypothetical protein A3A80_02520 [Candidatus Terrybacteria bacterium RIFCSPLOWO2_01_FULL_44_24]